MFALCVESSHQRGMGHLFRALNLAALLGRRCVPYLLLVNAHVGTTQILRERQVPFELVSLGDLNNDWEGAIIQKYGIKIWINDRLDTDIRHARKVKQHGVKLVTFDDRGSGAGAADLHFAPLAFDQVGTLEGQRVLRGLDYLILNPDIDNCRRLRTCVRSIVVSMGGSDTYGVTVRVVEMLRKIGTTATIITGPGFRHQERLRGMLTPEFVVKENVPALVEEFSRHDLAITGGGVTPFEANASGLPCIIIANEWSEVPSALYLERLGCSLFIGHHSEMDRTALDYKARREFSIESMSRAGLSRVSTRGLANVLQELQAL